jgi:hypothetical protein
MGSCETCKYQNKTEHEEQCNRCTHNATDNYNPMTNADRIRSMTDEQIAYYLEGFAYGGMKVDANKILKWLQSEVEDDTRTSN